MKSLKVIAALAAMVVSSATLAEGGADRPLPPDRHRHAAFRIQIQRRRTLKHALSPVRKSGLGQPAFPTKPHKNPL